MLKAGQSKMDGLARCYGSLKVDVRASSCSVPDDLRQTIRDVCTSWVALHGLIVKLQSNSIAKSKPIVNDFQEGCWLKICT